MTVPEDPPGFVVRTEAQKASWDNGYRIERETGPGGWLRYGSTTALGDIWIGGVSPGGPWFLSVDHAGVVAELAALPVAPESGPGLATFVFDGLTPLHAALDRVYKLGASLPDAPLSRFRAKVTDLPQTTEVERLVVQRIGQDEFRAALMDYWGGCCAVTGLAVPELLRASHIKPWAACETDGERLDVFNGLLLAPNLDAAFDRGLITVADNGAVRVSPALSIEAAAALGFGELPRIIGLGERHQEYLRWHRKHLFTAAET
jgi:hypothetical protein